MTSLAIAAAPVASERASFESPLAAVYLWGSCGCLCRVAARAERVVVHSGLLLLARAPKALALERKKRRAGSGWRRPWRRPRA